MQNYVNINAFGGVNLVAGTTAGAGTVDIGTHVYLAFPVPSDNLGGGLTITDFSVHATGTIAAASAPQWELVSLSSAGGTIVGTIGSLGSVAYSGEVPKAGTITDGWVDNDDGEYYVALKHKQTAALAPGTIGVWAVIGFQQGR